MLPAQADRDRTHVSRSAVMRSVRETEFGIDLNAAGHLPCYSGAKVVSELVLAGIDKLPAQGKAGVEASAPPSPKRVAGRARNCGVGVQAPGSMKESRTRQNVSAILAGYGNVDDRIKRDAEDVTSGAARLGQFQSGVAQRQICKNEIGAQPQLFVRVACPAGPAHNSSTSHDPFLPP